MSPEIRANLIHNGALPEELAALDAIQEAFDARFKWYQDRQNNSSKIVWDRNDLLWDLLSALRGPDGSADNYGNLVMTDDLKDRSTLVVRGALFSCEGFPARISGWQQNTVVHLKRTDQTAHFRSHIFAACKALGIDVTLDGCH